MHILKKQQVWSFQLFNSKITVQKQPVTKQSSQMYELIPYSDIKA